ncbi:MAG TPA: DUF4386 domain-containing protein [Blastocatellia bacterium]
METITTASPQMKARMAGLFYLLTFLVGVAFAVANGKLYVPGDPAATAANILAHPHLLGLGFAADVIVVACYIAVTALFYELFAPVSSGISRLAAFFSLVGCAIQGASCLFDLAPQVVLSGKSYLSVFKLEQLQALSLMPLGLHAQAFNICFAVFGFYCVLIGYLAFRSTFLPRVIGVLMMFGGLCWLTFLFPPLASALSPYIRIPGIIGEGSLTLWLLVMGVNVQRWQACRSDQWNTHTRAAL